MNKLITGVLCCGLILTLPVQAEINKCKGADGKLYFTDKPCPSQTKLESSELTPSEKREQEWDKEREKRATLDKQQADLAAQNKVSEELGWRNEKIRILNSWKLYTENEYGLVNDENSNTIPAVEVALKKILKDPDSLVMEGCEPVLTNGLRYRARCKYRAKNSYGGYNRYATVFYFNIHGEYTSSAESTGKPLALEGTSY